MAGESAAPGESRNKHSRYCIEKMFGVTVAVDSLTRYVNRYDFTDWIFCNDTFISSLFLEIRTTSVH